MDIYALLDLATDLGYELAMCGAETFRVEESCIRLLRAYGLEPEVFAIPNNLIVGVLGENGEPITRVRRIGSHGNDLDALERYNDLARRLCAQRPPISEALEQFRQTREHLRHYSSWVGYLGAFLAAAGFCLCFSGCLWDTLCSGLCGILVQYIGTRPVLRSANAFFTTILSAFALSVAAYGMEQFGLAGNADLVSIGALMLLVPGLLFTNAMRDVIYGDTNSGINRIVQVLLIAVAISLGTAGAWNIAQNVWELLPSGVECYYPVVAHCLFAFTACVGFAILFNIHGVGLLLCSLGGACCWGIYLLMIRAGYRDLTGYLFSAIFASLYAEFMARFRRAPATPYSVIAIFPLIPGAGVYYSMRYALQGHTAQFASGSLHTAAIAGTIAVGILLGSTVYRVYANYKFSKKATGKS